MQTVAEFAAGIFLPRTRKVQPDSGSAKRHALFKSTWHSTLDADNRLLNHGLKHLLSPFLLFNIQPDEEFQRTQTLAHRFVLFWLALIKGIIMAFGLGVYFFIYLVFPPKNI